MVVKIKQIYKELEELHQLKEAVIFFINQPKGTKIDQRLDKLASFNRLKELVKSDEQ